MTENDNIEIDKRTKKELIDICKRRSIKGYSLKTKPELIQLINDTPCDFFETKAELRVKSKTLSSQLRLESDDNVKDIVCSSTVSGKDDNNQKNNHNIINDTNADIQNNINADIQNNINADIQNNINADININIPEINNNTNTNINNATNNTNDNTNNADIEINTTKSDEILALIELRKSHSISNIANKLNIASGTVQRWIDLNNIPKQYMFDFSRLLSKNIDYSKFPSSQKDQFFTPPIMAKQCWDKFIEIANINPDDYIFIEPSAGDGSFAKCLPENSILLDIEPRCENIKQQDYLLWHPNEINLDANNLDANNPDANNPDANNPDANNPNITKYIVIGNPPFGLRGHTALNFINHSYKFADYVAFILPQLFESDGKGSPRKRVIGYNLIYSEKITGDFHTPENTLVDINGVFQIWSKYQSNENYTLSKNADDKIIVYSLSDGGTVATTRNKKMIDICDIYLPSTCFGKSNMKSYASFNELPNKKGYGVVFKEDKEKYIEKCRNIDWSSVGFLSTNSAYNLRTSLILKSLMD